MRAYPAYKDSGVEWLGDVPEHWGVTSLKFCARLEYGESLASDARCDGEVPVFGSNGPVGLHDQSNTLSPAVVVGRKGSFGKVSYTDVPVFCIDTTYFTDGRFTRNDLRWLYYLLQAARLDDVSQDTGVPGLSREDAHSRKVSRPSLPEQHAIATLLDRETAKIDSLVSNYQRLISLLQERRQSLISHTVTKGLDPDAPMKDSGVEWLGEVPEHWGIDRVKRRFQLLTEKTNRHEHRVALENIESWSGRFFETETEYEGDGVAFLPGDVLFGKLRPYLAKVYLAENAGEAVGDFHVLRPDAMLEGRFAQYQILGRDFIAIVDGATFGAKMPRVDWEFLGNMSFMIPPREEQHAIAAFLDQETAKIDSLVKQAEKAMDLLKERRTALISAAVTGKVDVRGTD